MSGGSPEALMIDTWMDLSTAPHSPFLAVTLTTTQTLLCNKKKADPELEGHSFIAVYDGHGGQFSAIYCGRHMIDFLKRTAAFQDYKSYVAHTKTRVCQPQLVSSVFRPCYTRRADQSPVITIPHHTRHQEPGRLAPGGGHQAGVPGAGRGAQDGGGVRAAAGHLGVHGHLRHHHADAHRRGERGGLARGHVRGGAREADVEGPQTHGMCMSSVLERGLFLFGFLLLYHNHHPISLPLSKQLDDERKRIEEAGGMVSMQRVDGAC